MSSIPPRDRGLTDVVDPLVPARLRPVLDLVDGRAGVRVDDDGIELRQLLRRRVVPWGDVTTIRLESRLDLLLAVGTRLLPVRRVPVVGGLLTDGARGAASAVTRRLLPGVRGAAGWSLTSIERTGRLRGDIDVGGGAWLTALVSPALTDSLVAQARMRHIPVARG